MVKVEKFLEMIGMKSQIFRLGLNCVSWEIRLKKSDKVCLDWLLFWVEATCCRLQNFFWILG